MGQRRYPPLTPAEVKAIVLALRFSYKRTKGGHSHYERDATTGHSRALVTIDDHYPEFDDDLIKKMIGQSTHSRNEFYGATKQTAKKGNVPLYTVAKV